MIRRSLALLLVAAALSDSALAAKLVFKDEFVVEGEVQQPDVAVFITRQNLNKAYDLELKESFLPKIIESVDHT